MAAPPTSPRVSYAAIAPLSVGDWEYSPTQDRSGLSEPVYYRTDGRDGKRMEPVLVLVHRGAAQNGANAPRLSS